MKGISSAVETEEVWNIILNDEKLLEKNQYGFVEAFIQTVKKIENQHKKSEIDEYNIYSSLLSMFNQNIHKINFAHNGVIEKLVKYTLTDYTEEQTLFGHRIKRRILENILNITLKDNQYLIFDYLFFKAAQEYYDNLEKINLKKSFIENFYTDLLGT